LKVSPRWRGITPRIHENGCEDGLIRIELGDLKVMSLEFLLRNQDDAVIWRGPMKMGVIKNQHRNNNK